jgi:hypothetical protein
MHGIQLPGKLGAQQRPTPVEATILPAKPTKKELRGQCTIFSFRLPLLPISWPFFRFARRMVGSASLSTGRAGADVGDAYCKSSYALNLHVATAGQTWEKVQCHRN